jgi:hypothetical protein
MQLPTPHNPAASNKNSSLPHIPKPAHQLSLSRDEPSQNNTSKIVSTDYLLGRTREIPTERLEQLVILRR